MGRAGRTTRVADKRGCAEYAVCGGFSSGAAKKPEAQLKLRPTHYFPLSTFYFLLSTFHFLLSTTTSTFHFLLSTSYFLLSSWASDFAPALPSPIAFAPGRPCTPPPVPVPPRSTSTSAGRSP